MIVVELIRLLVLTILVLRRMNRQTLQQRWRFCACAQTTAAFGIAHLRRGQHRSRNGESMLRPNETPSF